MYIILYMYITQYYIVRNTSNVYIVLVIVILIVKHTIKVLEIVLLTHHNGIDVHH